MDIDKRAKQYSDENWLIMEPRTTEKSFKAGAEWYRDNVVNKNEILPLVSNSLLDLDGKTIPVTFHVSKYKPKIDIDLSNDC